MEEDGLILNIREKDRCVLLKAMDTLIDKEQDTIDHSKLVKKLMKCNNVDNDSRNVAFDIITLFEAILDKHDITLPDIFREGNEDEARLYGDTYYGLEDKIVKIVNEL